jgi:hypothetical protein
MLFLATGVSETQIDKFHVVVFDHLQGFYGHLNLQDFQLLNAEQNQPF